MARLNAVLTSCEFRCPDIVAIVRLLMLTGCRFSQIASLEWDWIRGKRVHLPDSKSGPRTVWLSSAARSVIDAIPRYGEDCPYLFPARPPTWPVANIACQWKRIRDEAELPGLRLHDLRHTCAASSTILLLLLIFLSPHHSVIESTPDSPNSMSGTGVPCAKNPEFARFRPSPISLWSRYPGGSVSTIS